MSQNERCHCHKLTPVIFGSQPNQRDGLLFITLSNADTLHGTDDNPGGLMKAHADLKKEVEELKAWRWKMIGVQVGAFTVINSILIPLIVKWMQTK